MKKNLIVLSLIATLGTGGIMGVAVPAKAAGNAQIDLESRISAANSKINYLQNQLEAAQQESQNLTNAISDAQIKIKEKNEQITKAKQNIDNLQAQINEITKRMEQRKGLLKDRARSFQDSGGAIKYVEVLLGSKNFSDFIDRAGAVATIVEADRDILKEHQTDKETVEKSQAKLKSELATLETIFTDLKKLEEGLTEKKQQQTNFILGLKDQEKGIQAEVSRLQGEKSDLINKSVENEKSNLAVQNSQKDQQQQTGSNPAIVTPAQTGESGYFIWPTIGGIITTYQGMRWGEFHKGIDIARPADYAILAASGGTVSYAGWINGYGNTIKINHDNGYSTQYAHLDSISVSAGQAVKQGSRIGIMGSTGFSTGIHLDFEVYQNGKLVNPTDVLPKR
ncbi:murein hydrolase activator EnvC family protein [Bacillota bacterium Lsc_1132]